MRWLLPFAWLVAGCAAAPIAPPDSSPPARVAPAPPPAAPELEEPVDDGWGGAVQEPYVEGACNVQPTVFDAVAGTNVELPASRVPPGERLAAQLARMPLGEDASAIAAGPARRVMQALSRGDFKALARMTDARGVCIRGSFSRGCRWMKPGELASCAASTRAERWNIDTGSEDPKDTEFTCSRALRQHFFRRGFVASPRARVAYNCFPADPMRSNCGGGYVDAEAPGDVYVEYHLPDLTYEGGMGWRSLWLTFARVDGRVVLRGMMSEYWGV